jgi:hypothetical protein
VLIAIQNNRVDVIVDTIVWVEYTQPSIKFYTPIVISTFIDTATVFFSRIQNQKRRLLKFTTSVLFYYFVPTIFLGIALGLLYTTVLDHPVSAISIFSATSFSVSSCKTGLATHQAQTTNWSYLKNKGLCQAYDWGARLDVATAAYQSNIEYHPMVWGCKDYYISLNALESYDKMADWYVSKGVKNTEWFMFNEPEGSDSEHPYNKHGSDCTFDQAAYAYKLITDSIKSHDPTAKFGCCAEQTGHHEWTEKFREVYKAKYAVYPQIDVLTMHIYVTADQPIDQETCDKQYSPVYAIDQYTSWLDWRNRLSTDNWAANLPVYVTEFAPLVYEDTTDVCNNVSVSTPSYCAPFKYCGPQSEHVAGSYLLNGNITGTGGIVNFLNNQPEIAGYFMFVNNIPSAQRKDLGYWNASNICTDPDCFDLTTVGETYFKLASGASPITPASLSPTCRIFNQTIGGSTFQKFSFNYSATIGANQTALLDLFIQKTDGSRLTATGCPSWLPNCSESLMPVADTNGVTHFYYVYTFGPSATQFTSSGINRSYTIDNIAYGDYFINCKVKSLTTSDRCSGNPFCPVNNLDFSKNVCSWNSCSSSDFINFTITGKDPAAQTATCSISDVAFSGATKQNMSFTYSGSIGTNQTARFDLFLQKQDGSRISDSGCPSWLPNCSESLMPVADTNGVTHFYYVYTFGPSATQFTSSGINRSYTIDNIAYGDYFINCKVKSTTTSDKCSGNPFCPVNNPDFNMNVCSFPSCSANDYIGFHIPSN